MIDPGPVFVLFVLVGVGVLTMAWVRASRRRDAARTIAGRLGLQYSEGDPLGVLDLPHRLFRKGDRRRIETTLHGTLDGRSIVLCDFVFTETSRDAQGNTSQRDYRWSLCALALSWPLPWIEITPEGLGRRLLNVLGVGNDVQFESDEFNRAFTVLSRDRDFAFTLIDPAMIEWLTANADDCHIEIEGRDLVLAVREIPWEQMPRLARLVMEFQDRIPPLVGERYGGSR